MTREAAPLPAAGGELSPAGIGSVLAAASLVMASTTCVTAVLPQISRDLAATQTEVQWIADAYPLALSALLLPCGAVLDRVGSRRGLLGGLVVLTLALIWSGVAGSPAALIASRVVAGIGSALVFPATLASIGAGLREGRRSRAVATWAAAVMAGGGWGLVLGGTMAEVTSWQSAFVVMGALSALVLLRAVGAVAELRERAPTRLDVLGAALSCAAVGSATLAIIEVPVRSLRDPLVLASAAVALVAALAFIAHERRCAAPMLEVRLFANRLFSASSAAIFAMFGAAFGWFFLSFQFYSFVFGWGPLESALGLLPNIVPLVAFVPVGLWLAARYGRRGVMVVGLAVMAVGALLTGVAGDLDSPAAVFAGFALIGAGGGLGQGPATQAIVDALPAAKQGVASAVNDAARELGAAAGIATIGSAFTAGYRRQIEAAFSGKPPAEVVASPATAVAAHPHDGGLLHAVEQATIAGWQAGMVTAAGVLALGALFVHLRLRRHERPAAELSAGSF